MKRIRLVVHIFGEASNDCVLGGQKKSSIIFVVGQVYNSKNLKRGSDPKTVTRVVRFPWSSAKAQILPHKAPSPEFLEFVERQNVVQFVHEVEAGDGTECGTTVGL